MVELRVGEEEMARRPRKIILYVFAILGNGSKDIPAGMESRGLIE